MNRDQLFAFIERHKPNTPALVLDLTKIRERYALLRRQLPDVEVYYSVKANPEPAILALFCELGASFEVASVEELKRCVRSGAHPARIHFGNPIKKRADIRYAHRLGVRSFSFDSGLELEKLVEEAPGCSAVVRIATDGSGAVWGLTKKFGVPTELAITLLERAHTRGLAAHGVSFHVGSQQSDPDAWHRALTETRRVIDALEDMGIQVVVVNLGGGLPADGYRVERREVHFDFEAYLSRIREHADALQAGIARPLKFMIEPGRFLVANAGAVVSKVVLDTHRIVDGREQRWVYLDVGKFNGLYEATDLHLPFGWIPRAGSASNPASGRVIDTILAGPTCDSDDVLLPPNIREPLPEDVAEGDLIVIPAGGAYTTSYVTSGFNGFHPMNVYCLDEFDPDLRGLS
jgi:ornithine decarboxylase